MVKSLQYNTFKVQMPANSSDEGDTTNTRKHTKINKKTMIDQSLIYFYKMYAILGTIQ